MFKRDSVSLPLVMTYSLLLNSGAACIWPLVTLYIHNDLHQSLTVAGAVLLLMSGFMIIGNYLGGYLFDRWSAYYTSIIFITLSTVAVLALIFFHGWPAFGCLLMPIGLGDGVNLTLTNAYSTAINNRSDRYIFNIMYIGLNIGVVVGTAMVGFLLKYGIKLLFCITSLFYLALLIMTVLRFNVDFSRLSSKGREFVGKRTVNRGGHLMLMALICVMTFCIYLSYSLWDSVMSVHMTELGMSFAQYSWVWVVNGLLIVAGQALINRVFNRIRISAQVAFGVFIFSLSYFGLIPAHHYLAFVMSMIVLTFGEMIALPDIPAWIDGFAEPGKRGRYQAYFNVFMNGGRAVGPLFDGIVVEGLGYSALFGISGVVVLVSLGLVMLELYRRSRLGGSRYGSE